MAWQVTSWQVHGWAGLAFQPDQAALVRTVHDAVLGFGCSDIADDLTLLVAVAEPAAHA